MMRGVVEVEQSEGGGAAAGSSSSSSPAAAPALPEQSMTVGGVSTVVGVLVVFAAVTLGFVLLSFYCDERRGALTASSPSWRRRRRRRDGVGGVDGGATGGEGVDPEVLRSLPVTLYRAGPVKEEGMECAVCLAELEDGEEARFLPRCGHGFHAECIDLWLESHSTCPLCRLTVVIPDVPPPSATLPPVPPEPANYTVNLPASVVLLGGLSDQGAVTAVTLRPEEIASPAGDTAVLVIEIPESAASTPRDSARSPCSARLRSLRTLWSFGRQGAGSTSTSSRGGGDDVEHCVSVTVGICVVEAPPVPPEAETGATPAQESRRMSGISGGERLAGDRLLQAVHIHAR